MSYKVGDKIRFTDKGLNECYWGFDKKRGITHGIIHEERDDEYVISVPEWVEIGQIILQYLTKDKLDYIAPFESYYEIF